MNDAVKPASKSKTIWFNVIQAIFALAEGVTGIMQQHVSFNVYLIMLSISIGGNAALRYYTTQSIGRPVE